MSWTVKLVGTNAYLATDNAGAVDDTHIQQLLSGSGAEIESVTIYAANPQRTVEADGNIVDNNLAIVSGQYVDELTLHLMPYHFPNDEPARESMLTFVTKYIFYYAQNDDYPAWWQSRNDPNKWWAVKIASYEHEHKHSTAVKHLRLKLYFTRW